jgi:hypothetical protein
MIEMALVAVLAATLGAAAAGAVSGSDAVQRGRGEP